jgi:hypothetical protein
MKKRFTDIHIWADVWYRKMTPAMKLLWKYICDNCDDAGIWKVDLELAAFCIGVPLAEEEIQTAFFDPIRPRVEQICDGKWWVIKFCEFQYDRLSDKCPPQTKAFRSLVEHDLLDRVAYLMKHNLPGAAPLTAQSGTHTIPNGEPGAISKSLSKEPAPARAGKTVSKPVYDLNDFPTLNTPEFAAAFEEWLAYRARRKPAVKTPALMLKKLSAYPVADAIAAMQESETMGYQGVFPEKIRGKAVAPPRPKLVNIGPSEGFTAEDLEF